MLLSLQGSVLKRLADSTTSTASGQMNGQTSTSGLADTTGGQTSATSRQVDRQINR